MPWSLCGVISWSLRVFSRERMSLSFQGIVLKPNFWMFSKHRQCMRKVLKRVSPSRSRYSWWTFSPFTAWRYGMSLAKGQEESDDPVRPPVPEMEFQLPLSGCRLLLEAAWFPVSPLCLGNCHDGWSGMKDSPSSPVHTLLLLLKRCMKGRVRWSCYQCEQAEAGVIDHVSLIWWGRLWYPVEAICNEVVHPGRRGHHVRLLMSSDVGIPVKSRMDPRCPRATLHGLRVVWRDLLEAELHEEFPFRLCGENPMIKEAVTDMFRKADHC